MNTKLTLTLQKEVIKNIKKYVAVGEIKLIEALKAGFSDFEVAIQSITAGSVEGLNIILTRNAKDFNKSKLPILSPEVFVKTWSAK